MSKVRLMGVRAALAPLFAAAAMALTPGVTRADTVDLFPVNVDFGSKACATYGDFVSCSAQYLNFLNTGNPAGDGTYNAVTTSPQGSVANFLTILAGGAGGHSNDPYRVQQGPNIDDPYNPNGQGTLTDYGTRRNNAGTVAAPILKPCTDPSPNLVGEVTGPCSNLTAWDIGIHEMVGALSAGGVLHDMLIMFDNNQVGSDPSQLIRAWGMVCAYNSATGPTGTQKCFELFDQNGIANENSNGPVTAFTTSKTYGQFEDGHSNNLVTAHGVLCVDNVTGDVTQFDFAACPAGSTKIDNNLGTNDTEFITKIPELDLLQLAAQGFDRLAFQFQLYNQNDGFEDVYILAGAPLNRVPEPGTLALVGLAMFGLAGWSRRRKS